MQIARVKIDCFFRVGRNRIGYCHAPVQPADGEAKSEEIARTGHAPRRPEIAADQQPNRAATPLSYGVARRMLFHLQFKPPELSVL